MTLLRTCMIAFRVLANLLQRRQMTLENFASRSSDHFESSPQRKELVSIIIPTRDKTQLLKECINSIFLFEAGADFEVVIVDNLSKDPEAIKYLEELSLLHEVRVIKYPYKFNFSAICNVAANESSGNFFCFLNNDVIIKSDNWLGSLLAHAGIKNTGWVGTILRYEDNSIQHAGIALNQISAADHPYRGIDLISSKSLPPLASCFEVEAVTFACAMIKRDVFEIIGKMSIDFPVGYNDVDACLSASKSGYANVVCCETSLVHLETQSRPRRLSLKGLALAFVDLLHLEKKWHISKTKDRYFKLK